MEAAFTRTLVATSALNQNAIVRIRRALALKTHWQENFKLSTDPLFAWTATAELIPDRMELIARHPSHFSHPATARH